jgi:hypothetical protein
VRCSPRWLLRLRSLKQLKASSSSQDSLYRYSGRNTAFRMRIPVRMSLYWLFWKNADNLGSLRPIKLVPCRIWYTPC